MVGPQRGSEHHRFTHSCVRLCLFIRFPSGSRTLQRITLLTWIFVIIYVDMSFSAISDEFFFFISTFIPLPTWPLCMDH